MEWPQGGKSVDVNASLAMSTLGSHPLLLDQSGDTDANSILNGAHCVGKVVPSPDSFSLLRKGGCGHY